MSGERNLHFDSSNTNVSARASSDSLSTPLSGRRFGRLHIIIHGNEPFKRLAELDGSVAEKSSLAHGLSQ